MKNRTERRSDFFRALVLVTSGVAALFAVAPGGVVTSRLRAQTPAAQAETLPSFEVASVKINKSGEPFMRIAPAPGGRFTVTNLPVRELIRFAYQLQSFQIEGGPSWITSDRFDIVAKAEGSPAPIQPGGPPGPLQLMMQSLLKDRFKLTVHNETKQMPIYALVRARSDGRLGPQLKQSTVDCAAMMTARGRGGAPPAPPAPGERPMCGMRFGPGQIAAGGLPLSQLAVGMSQMVQRVIVDRTGLTGNFDLEVTFTPDQMPQGTPPPGAPPLPPIDPNGPSIFTALQEQLGLNLESQRGPVEVLVIDRVEHPTED